MPVLGTDNFTPIQDPSIGNRIWLKSQLYLGTTARDKYVPSIGDIAMSISGSQYTFEYISDVNATTLVPTFTYLKATPDGSLFTDADLLLGVGPGTPVDTYKLYIDKRSLPYNCTVDRRCYIPALDTLYCKVFRGTDLSNNGDVVSKVYDNLGNVISENITLVSTVATPVAGAPTQKYIPTFYTTENLPEGEVVTAVFYNNSGVVISKHQLIVEESSFVRPLSASRKYITNISLQSPFLTSGSQTLYYPINVPLAGLNLIGVVTYSDGTTNKIPVDGNQFRITGFEEYQATQIGQSFEIMLSYTLGLNETYYGTGLSDDGLRVSKIYDARTRNIDMSYGFKLYAIPVWIDAVVGYTLQWKLFNLSRNIHYDVTSYVTINPNFTAFRPTLYGTVQNLNVQINVSLVDASLPNYIHSQSLQVILYRAGNQRPNPWAISYDPGQYDPYGANQYCLYWTTAGVNKFNIGAGLADLNSWLANTYTRSRPLTDINIEPNAPTPTHIRITYKGSTLTEVPIANWNSDMVSTVTIDEYSSMLIEFLYESGGNTQYLSCINMFCYLDTTR